MSTRRRRHWRGAGQSKGGHCANVNDQEGMVQWRWHGGEGGISKVLCFGGRKRLEEWMFGPDDFDAFIPSYCWNVDLQSFERSS